jgi:hypothetical protein
VSCTREIIAATEDQPDTRVILHHPPSALRRIATVLWPGALKWPGGPSAVGHDETAVMHAGGRGGRVLQLFSGLPPRGASAQARQPCCRSGPAVPVSCGGWEGWRAAGYLLAQGKGCVHP